MKTVNRFAICASICFLLSNPIYAEEWKVTSLDWQPYSGADISDGGNSVVKLREILAKAGIDLVIEFYPWARAQKLALTEEYVGYFPAWPEEVYDGFVGSDPVDFSHVGVMTYAGSNLQWKSLEDLFQNYKVGHVGTYAYPEKIETLKAQYPDAADSAPNEILLMRKLSRGRNDVALTDPSVMSYNANLEGIYNIEVLNASIEKKALLLSFRQGADNDDRIKLLNELLQEYSIADQ